MLNYRNRGLQGAAVGLMICCFLFYHLNSMATYRHQAITRHDDSTNYKYSSSDVTRNYRTPVMAPYTEEKTTPGDLYTVGTLRRRCRLLAHLGLWDAERDSGKHPMGAFYIAHAPRVLFCQIRKGGSQYWNSLVQVLDNTRQASSSTYHYKGNAQIYHEMRMHYRKVMHVSDPWRRLWSAYNDKFANLHPKFLTKYDRMLRLVIAARGGNVATACLDHVTFCDFIELVLLEDRTSDRFDAHWNPYWRQCRPCSNRFDFVGKMEEVRDTFADMVTQMRLGEPKDLQASMASPNYSSSWFPALARLGRDIHRRERHDLYPQECQTLKRLLTSKWQSLINQGYISPRDQLPVWVTHVEGRFRRGDNRTISALSSIRSAVRARSEVYSSRKQAEFKKRAMETAIGNLTNEQICQIEKIYSRDFILFEYPQRCKTYI